MAQQLAKHCVLEDSTDRKITLRLSQAHKHLQTNKSAIEKLQAALTAYFVKPIKLEFMGESGSATPAAIEQHTKNLKQQLAADSIAKDSFVREAQLVGCNCWNRLSQYSSLGG